MNIIKLYNMLLHLRDIAPEADSCYYQDKCKENCYVMKQEKKKWEAEAKKLGLKEKYSKRPCMLFEIDKIIKWLQNESK